MKAAAVFLVFLASEVVAREIDYCYNMENDPYLSFGTKTAYNFVHGGKAPFQRVRGCKAVQMWFLGRHGTRYPGKGVTANLAALPRLRDQIIYNHETRGYGHLCDEDLENLKMWRLDQNLNPQNADKLINQGREDMTLLAMRLRSNFPEILQPDPVNITSANYKFKATDTQRTKASMEAFMTPLFGNSLPTEIAKGNDSLIRAYKNCPSWQSESNNDPIVSEQAERFMNGSDYSSLLKNVSRRLGFLYNINSTSVGLMYDMCRYEKAWLVNRPSAWCAVFNKEELQVLEYKEDLTDYYYSGYGRKSTAQVGCSLVKDVFEHFRKLQGWDWSSEPRGIFYFTHSTMIEVFLTAMGIAKDSTPLTASNYREMGKRQWRTSKIAPFASNVVAVFYKCNNAGGPNKVMFYLQEKPVLYEGCDVGLCDWEYVKNKLGSVADECNTASFCYGGSGAQLQSRWYLHLLPLFSLARVLRRN